MKLAALHGMAGGYSQWMFGRPLHRMTAAQRALLVAWQADEQPAPPLGEKEMKALVEDEENQARFAAMKERQQAMKEERKRQRAEKRK